MKKVIDLKFFFTFRTSDLALRPRSGLITLHNLTRSSPSVFIQSVNHISAC